jgi:hypothetical protein
VVDKRLATANLLGNLEERFRALTKWFNPFSPAVLSRKRDTLVPYVIQQITDKEGVVVFERTPMLAQEGNNDSAVLLFR